MTRYPTGAIGLCAMAASMVVVVTLLPFEPWLAPAVKPLATGASLLWTLWRVLTMWNALTVWHAWHYNGTRTLNPEELAHEHKTS